MSPEVTVVIPTYDRARSLEASLRSLIAQGGAPPFDVVVADDGSSDDTGETVARLAAPAPVPIRHLALPHAGPAAARNAGLRAATGRLVVFLDDDERVREDFVAAHANAHREHPEPHQGVIGLVEWAPEIRRTRFTRWLDRSSLQFGFHYMEAGPVVPSHAAFVTANLSVKRAFLIDNDLWFDERFPYAAFEDTDLGWRLDKAGFELYYHPEAVAMHARRFTVRGFSRRMERVGESFPLFRSASPDYPLDEAFFLRGPSPRKAIVLRAASPVLRLVGPERLVGRYYDDRVARAFRRGRARAS